MTHLAAATRVAAASCRSVHRAEALVAGAIREQIGAAPDVADADLVQETLASATLHGDRIDIVLRPPKAGEAADQPLIEQTCSVPFQPTLPPRKGVTHTPAHTSSMDEATRTTLLAAIAQSRRWVDQVLSGDVSGFDVIAAAEGLTERHVRRLAVLAHLSPKISQAIVDGTVPTGLTLSALAQSLPYAWSEQEGAIQLR